MANLEAKVTLSASKEMNELFEIIAENIDALPDSVRNAARALGDSDSLIWDSAWLKDNGYINISVSVFADGVKMANVKCLYPFRKVIAFYDENTLVREIKAEHAQMKLDDGYVIREW